MRDKATFDAELSNCSSGIPIRCLREQERNFDTLSVRKYLDSSLATVNEEKRYASLYPRALEPHASNTVRLHPETAGQELLQPVHARWNGTLDDITRKAARMAGYSVRANGERSGSPILVSVHWADMTLLGLLREAFGQERGVHGWKLTSSHAS
ncbi:DotD/TraH family lipoprotein [Ochrobactrum oryzae]|nr:DotD/TraH family lipoprotein [Brucella oryzae]